MVEISDIKDRDSLKEWLKTQPPEASVAIAARAALRVLPIFWQYSLTSDARKNDSTALPILRCCLVSGNAANTPTPEIKEAAARAARAAPVSPAAYMARSAARAAVHAARAVSPSHATLGTAAAAADARNAAGNAASGAANAAGYVDTDTAVWHAVRVDCFVLIQGEQLMERPLWPDEHPLANVWSEIRAKILSDDNWQPGDWSFWVNWYDKMLDPQTNPPNWPLLERIALIAPEVWDAGPEAVSKKIAEIQRDFDGGSDAKGGSGAGKVGTDASVIHKPDNRDVATAKRSMELSKRDLPPTFDAISALILSQVERLQNKNYTSDLDRDECLRQIAVFVSLYEAIETLRVNFPQDTPVTDAQAEASVSTLQLYYQSLVQLPREQVGAVKEGVRDAVVAVSQFGVIGALSSVGIYYGLPQYGAVAAAAYCVAPKKAGEILAVAKGLLQTKSEAPD